MNTRSSDFEYPPARGGQIPFGTEPGVAEVSPNQLPADEAALMNILRLMNRIGPYSSLTPVERAFLLGAKAMFKELTEVCNKLLEAPPPPIVISTASAPPATSDTAEESTTGRTRSRRRSTPGGASSQ